MFLSRKRKRGGKRDGKSAAATEQQSGELWACIKCTPENHPDLLFCEICETARPKPKCNSRGGPSRATRTSSRRKKSRK